MKEREDVAKPPADSNDEDAKTNPYLVVGNTDNNETVQGFIRQGRTMWLGTFGLPPAPHGKEEEVSHYTGPLVQHVTTRAERRGPWNNVSRPTVIR